MTGGRPDGRIRSAGPFGLIVGLVALALVLLGPGVGSVGAHTDLLQGSPGPGQRAGGTVDFVDLVFVAPVSGATVSVTGPDGEPIDGEMDVADGQIIRFRMERLTAPGRYLVDYRMVSDDGDDTEAGYFFLYEVGAVEPARLGRADVPVDNSGTVRTVVGAVVVVVLVVICLVLLDRFRRSRAALVAYRNERDL